MIKYTIYTLLIIILISCQDSRKSKKMRADGKIISSNDVNDLKIYFDNDSIDRVISEKKGYEIVFQKGNINNILGFALIDSNYVNERINFAPNGIFLGYLWYNKRDSESYSVNNEPEHIEISLFKRFRMTDVLQRISDICIDKVTGDTFDFFYYESIPYKGFQICTDLSYLIYNPIIVDSTVIEYVEHSLTEKNYYSPNSINVLPDLSGFKTKKIKNSLFIPTQSSVVVGTFWAFGKPTIENKEPYTYQFLYLKGNSLDRMKQYERKYIDFKKKYNYNTLKNKEIVNDLIETGYYKLENGKLIRDKRGEN